MENKETNMEKKSAGDTRIANVENPTSFAGSTVERSAIEVDQRAMAAVDAAIAQAVEVMSATREQIALTLSSRTTRASGEEYAENGPVAMIAGSRRRILDQMSATRTAINGGQTDVDHLLRLNAQLLERITDLARGLAGGDTPTKLYLVELRTEVGNYLDRVDNLLNNRVTVQFS